MFNNYEVCLVCYLFSSPNETFVVCLTIKKKQLLHVFCWFIAHLSWRCKWDFLTSLYPFARSSVCIYLCLFTVLKAPLGEYISKGQKWKPKGYIISKISRYNRKVWIYSHHCNLSHSTHSPTNDGIRTVYPLLYIKTSKITPNRKNMYILISMCKKKCQNIDKLKSI